MNKLFIQSSVFVLSLLSVSGAVDASKQLSQDDTSPFSFKSAPSSGRSVIKARKNRLMLEDRSHIIGSASSSKAVVPYSASSSSFVFDFDGSSQAKAFSSSVQVEDDEEVIELSSTSSSKPNVLELDQETSLAVAHIQQLISTDQDLSLVLAMKTGRALFNNMDIFNAYFVPVISEAFERNGIYSFSATNILAELNEEQKSIVLAPYGYTRLFKAPVASRKARIKAKVLDGLTSLAGKVNPFSKQSKSKESKKRDYSHVASTHEFVRDATSEPLRKKRKLSEDFDTHQERLDYISQALKEHVQDVMKTMRPYFVADRGALARLVDATDMMNVHGVNMMGYSIEGGPSIQWGGDDIIKLKPALQLNRIQNLDLSGNLICDRLVASLNWNGIQTLDLSSNLISTVGSLLKSNINSLRLNANGIEMIQESETLTEPNFALEKLDMAHNQFDNTGMTAFLKMVSFMPNLKVLNVGTSSRNHFLSSSSLLDGLDVSHPSLRVLGLSGWSLSGDAINHVLSLPMIKVLDLSRVSFNKSALSPVHGRESSLETVVLSPSIHYSGEHKDDLESIRKKGIEMIMAD